MRAIEEGLQWDPASAEPTAKLVQLVERGVGRDIVTATQKSF